MKGYLYFLGIPLQLLGLCGLVDNVIVWQGFLAEIVEIYGTAKSIVFGFLPFQITSWLQDYVVIGIGFSLAHMKASVIASVEYVKSVDPISGNDLKLTNVFDLRTAFFFFLGFLLNVVIWPSVILTNIILLFWKPSEFPPVNIVQKFWPSVIFIYSIFLGALFIFSDLAQKI